MECTPFELEMDICYTLRLEEELSDERRNSVLS